MPPMPQMIVSQMGMLSLSPGATSLPSRPMITPPMRRPMISPTMWGHPFLPRESWISVPGQCPGSFIMAVPRFRGNHRTPGRVGVSAEADGARRRRAQLEVGDLVGGYDDGAALGVREPQHPAARERLGELRLD